MGGHDLEVNQLGLLLDHHLFIQACLALINRSKEGEGRINREAEVNESINQKRMELTDKSKAGCFYI